MLQRTLDLEYDQLIIGADLDALRFSYVNKIPVVYINRREPAIYDLNTHKERLDEYLKLGMHVSLLSLAPFSNLVQSIRIEDQNTLKVATKNNLSINVKANKIFISDDEKIEGLSEPEKTTGDDNLVLDYIDVSSGLYHDHWTLQYEDSFVNKIYFYLSDRFFYKNIDNKKDCVALSIIKQNNLAEFEFSETAVRLKTAKLMKEAGIKGRWDKTNGYFKTIKLSSRRREIHPLWKNLYTDFEVLYNIPAVTIDEGNLYGEIQKLQVQSV